jgi:hypothetical protein
MFYAQALAECGHNTIAAPGAWNVLLNTVHSFNFFFCFFSACMSAQLAAFK